MYGQSTLHNRNRGFNKDTAIRHLLKSIVFIYYLYIFISHKLDDQDTSGFTEMNTLHVKANERIFRIFRIYKGHIYNKSKSS